MRLAFFLASSLSGLLLPGGDALSWFRLDGGSTRTGLTAREETASFSEELLLPLYPLRATYLPHSMNVQLRNVEPRNKAMVKESKTMVVSLLGEDGASCAEVGAVLRVDRVEERVVDSYNAIFLTPRDEDEVATVMELTCRVVGRCRLVHVHNPEAWSDKSDYLRASVKLIEDDPKEQGSCEDTSEALGCVVTALRRRSAPSLVDAIEAARLHAELGEVWEALELWQRYCATQQAEYAASANAERSELLVGLAMAMPGPLTIPVNPKTLTAGGRSQLASLEARHKDERAQLKLETPEDFAEILANTSADARATRLAKAARREAARLDARASLDEAFQQVDPETKTENDI